MTPNQISQLAMQIWRRVLNHESLQGTELHDGCLADEPTNCSLFVEIYEELTAFERSQLP